MQCVIPRAHTNTISMLRLFHQLDFPIVKAHVHDSSSAYIHFCKTMENNDMNVSPLKIGANVEHKGFHYKIIDHQKPPNYVSQYLIQSLNSGHIIKVFRHEIFLLDSVPTNTNSSFDLEELSQSDTEILELNLEQLLQESDTCNNSAPAANTVPSVTILPSTSRFKATPTATELDTISEARTENTTDKQTAWGVKLFRGTKIKLSKHRWITY